MKTMKKSNQLILIATLTLCMLLTLFVPSTNVNAASKRTKALTAYRNFMEKRTSYYDQFALIYYNNDSTPDLFYNNYIDTAVYTYKKGKLVCLYKNSASGVYSSYYPRKRMLIGSYAHMGQSTETYYRSSGACLSKSQGLGIRKSIYNKISGYSYKSISKSTFNKTLKKYVGSKKKKKIKNYRNTAANRNKVLK